ncbi:solute carrier family 22 member 6-B-like isoform X2 [Ambystoma mexicanum]|uniref:solute carrier family 22 member 6-B-like isoform X2 n=1 Tax=Ambystoma mexicanum TaxID=8296 RepID=UPI0037E864CE
MSHSAMAFVDLIEKDRMGLFQILQAVLLAIPLTMVGSQNFMQIFSAATPEHHCRPATNISSGTSGSTPINLTKELLRVFIPTAKHQKFESCLRFTSPQWHLLGTNTTWSTGDLGIDTEACHNGWEYDQSVFSSTIVTQWDLVCNRKSWKEFAQSIYMAGVLVGAFGFGALADRFGRRTILLWCFLQIGALGVAAAFSPNFSTYCVFRFLSGMGVAGFIINDISLSVEWTPTKFRALVLSSASWCASLSQIVLAGLAYGIRDWHWLQIAISLPYLLFFLWTWWLPESARWHMMNNKPELALRDLLRVARINGKVLGDHINLETLKAEIQKGTSGGSARPTPLDLFRTPAMCRITCCLTLVWQTGVGFTNMMMRLGAVVAPLVLLVKYYIIFLPTIIFGVVPIFFGLSVLFLPETLNVCLPDSIIQVENRATSNLILNKDGNEVILKKTQF